MINPDRGEEERVIWGRDCVGGKMKPRTCRHRDKAILGTKNIEDKGRAVLGVCGGQSGVAGALGICRRAGLSGLKVIIPLNVLASSTCVAIIRFHVRTACGALKAT